MVAFSLEEGNMTAVSIRRGFTLCGTVKSGLGCCHCAGLQRAVACAFRAKMPTAGTLSHPRCRFPIEGAPDHHLGEPHRDGTDRPG